MPRIDHACCESSPPASAAARAWLADKGYDPVYGARPVKRVIQQSLQNPLATELLKGEYPEGTTIEVDYRGEEFTFRRVEQGEPATAVH